MKEQMRGLVMEGMAEAREPTLKLYCAKIDLDYRVGYSHRNRLYKHAGLDKLEAEADKLGGVLEVTVRRKHDGSEVK